MKRLLYIFARIEIIIGVIGSFSLAYLKGIIHTNDGTNYERNWLLTVIIFLVAIFCILLIYIILMAFAKMLFYLESINSQLSESKEPLHMGDCSKWLIDCKNIVMNEPQGCLASRKYWKLDSLILDIQLKFYSNEYSQLIDKILGLYGDWLHVMSCFSNHSKRPNGNASSPRIIRINMAWFKMMISQYKEGKASNEDLIKVFCYCVNHEIGHKERIKNLDYCGLDSSLKNRFIAQVEEVFADMRAGYRMGLSNIEASKLLELKGKIIFQYLYPEKSFSGKAYDDYRKKQDEQHPSIEDRIKYVKNGVLDSIIINEIAKKLEYKDCKVINDVICKYETYDLNIPLKKADSI